MKGLKPLSYIPYIIKAVYTNLKTATAISLNGSDVKETKLRLSKLVREVDKCIALLNE